MSESKMRQLPITKAQADECNRLNQIVTQVVANVSLYTTAILHGHGISTPHDLIRVVQKDDGYLLVVSERKSTSSGG